METDLGWWAVPLALIGGAIRISTPFLFVSLGETITEKSGRINLGLEGTLVFGAMIGYGMAYLIGDAWAQREIAAALAQGLPAPDVSARSYPMAAWLGVVIAAFAGSIFGLVHGLICSLKRVNDIAVGIAMMLFGMGIAFYFGKPFIAPAAPDLPSIPFAAWSDVAQVRDAFNVNILFLIGIALAVFLWWAFRNTRLGLVLRVVGDSADAARALGYDLNLVRTLATAVGGAFAGIAGAFLSLYYPGSWNEGISSGQGLMAVALVIFARWNPIACFWAAMLFGGTSALGPALQAVGVTGGYYLFNAAPYILTLALMIAISSKNRAMAGAPGELSITR
ncbi:MAG: ABC transporter permease [Bauldia sp.]|jgi:simple sugar transport system permease protein